MDEQVYKESRALLRMGMVHACGEGRRLWGEGGVFVPTVRTGGAEERLSQFPSRDDRAKQDIGAQPNVLREEIDHAD